MYHTYLRYIYSTEKDIIFVAFTPSDDAILVLGTSGEGPANTPFQATNLSTAAGTFGYNGSLYRALAEATSYSDNVIGYRIGTSPLILNGVGYDITPHLTVTLGTGGTAGQIASVVIGTASVPGLANGTFSATLSGGGAGAGGAVNFTVTGATLVSISPGFNITFGTITSDAASQTRLALRSIPATVRSQMWVGNAWDLLLPATLDWSWDRAMFSFHQARLLRRKENIPRAPGRRRAPAFQFSQVIQGRSYRRESMERKSVSNPENQAMK
jgi:hypothetical protein